MKIYYTFAWKIIEKMYYVYESRSRAHRVFGAKKSRLTCSAISFRTSFYLAILGHTVVRENFGVKNISDRVVVSEN